MTLLVLGAQGFIGSRIARALDEAGFVVRRAARGDFDMARDVSPAAWAPRLSGVSGVVNAVGILRSRGADSLEAVHHRGPAALFAACEAAGVAVIQVSALGADEGAPTEFLASKKRGDDALAAASTRYAILQPSLVYGAGGASARLFAGLASAPWIPLPGRGEQQVQPVHVDDLAAIVVALVRDERYPCARVPVVGPCRRTLRGFLADLRAAMGLGPGRFLHVPATVVERFAAWGIGLLDRDTWTMLQRGNVADAAPAQALLGRPLRSIRRFVHPDDAHAAAMEARMPWLLAPLRWAIAAVWIVAGVVSAGLYPVEESLALLERTRLTGPLAYVALYGAAALDFALGVATLAMKRRRALWALQAAVIAAYTAIISVFLPEQWLHPYGPVVKNLPLLAALFLLHQLEPRRR